MLHRHINSLIIQYDGLPQAFHSNVGKQLMKVDKVIDYLHKLTASKKMSILVIFKIECHGIINKYMKSSKRPWQLNIRNYKR